MPNTTPAARLRFSSAGFALEPGRGRAAPPRPPRRPPSSRHTGHAGPRLSAGRHPPLPLSRRPRLGAAPLPAAAALRGGQRAAGSGPGRAGGGLSLPACRAAQFRRRARGGAARARPGGGSGAVPAEGRRWQIPAGWRRCRPGSGSSAPGPAASALRGGGPVAAPPGQRQRRGCYPSASARSRPAAAVGDTCCV